MSQANPRGRKNPGSPGNSATQADTQSRPAWPAKGPGSSRYRLLAVGSLPPPLGGTSVGFQIFCNEARRHVELEVVNAAPRGIKEDPRLLSVENLGQALRVMGRVLKSIRNADIVLVVGSHQFMFTMGSVIALVARFFGRSCYLRSFAYLDRYYASQPSLVRWLFRKTLGGVTGILVETRTAQQGIETLIGADKVHWIPNYRVLPDEPKSAIERHSEGGDLRLVYLSQVREEKGIFVLLESLRTQGIQTGGSIQCDVYGPVFPSIADRFYEELRRTPNARYCGIVEPDDVVEKLSRYDALVFPSYWPSEGQPGVVIEAMMAGISIIATDHGSIPELIDDGLNGLLIEPGSPEDLAAAIQRLYADHAFLMDTSARNCERRNRHSAEHVVAQMIELMRPPA